LSLQYLYPTSAPGGGAVHVTPRKAYNNKRMRISPLRSARRRFELKDKHRDGLERGYAFGTASGGTTGSTSALSNN